MDSGHWYRLKGLFKEALQLESLDRSAFLEESCKDDANLRKELENLLAAESRADDILETPASPAMIPGGEGASLVDTCIGPYLIQDVISSGGMGRVYKAVRQSDQKTVAVKVMSHGIASKSALRRFEYESHFLGRLKHPNIAEVIESGAHLVQSESVPYFVMEFIPDARPVTCYAWDNKLAISERLRLFLQICDAVHHGHQRGIIHRDLKPSNILVDASGQVKVIDFGVARATDSDLHLTSSQTEVGLLLGTVQYMSPEQCRADPNELDVRSDVYALGVVLYELLCEELPYDVGRALVFEATRIIMEAEPKRPSAMKRDAETIVLKALEKDRKLRYQSVAEFGSDIERFLQGQVIRARPAGAVTRLSKWIKRNPVASTIAAMTAAAVLIIIAYIVFVAYPQIKSERDLARKEKERAVAAEMEAREARAISEREAETTKTINRFLEEVLSAADPINRGDGNIKLSLLNNAVERVDREFQDRPEIEASLRFTIGITYFNNGLSEAAEGQLRRAVEVFNRINGKEHGTTLRAMNWLGYILLQQGKVSEAEDLLLDAVKISKTVLGQSHRITLKSMQFYAALLRKQRNYSEAEKLLRETVDNHRRNLEQDHEQTLESMYELSLVLWKQGKLSEAASMLREVISKRSRILGEKHIKTLETRNDLALVISAQGDYAEAESIHRDILLTYNAILGQEHPHTLMVMNNLSKALERQAKYSEAESLLRKVVEIQDRSLSDEHPHLLLSKHNLAQLLTRQDKLVEAEGILLDVLSARVRTLGEEHEDSLQTKGALAQVCWFRGNLSAAEPVFRQVLEIQIRILGDKHPDTLITKGSLANLLEELGEFEEAESMHREVLGVRSDTLGKKHPDTLKSIINLANVLKNRGKIDEAESAFREALPICRTILGEDHTTTFGLKSNLAVVLSMQGRVDEAIVMHHEVLDTCRTIFPKEHMNTITSIGNLATALKNTQHYSEAAGLLKEGIGISERLFPQGHFMTASLHTILGECLIYMKRFEEAETHLLEGHARLTDNLGVEHWRTRSARDSIIKLYETWEKPREAARWRDDG